MPHGAVLLNSGTSVCAYETHLILEETQACFFFGFLCHGNQAIVYRDRFFGPCPDTDALWSQAMAGHNVPDIRTSHFYKYVKINAYNEVIIQ